ncbi:MAG: tRNA (adenosine(37)-N6)-dimethylallyltransferase MiaA [Candidatus Marinimicrobia bacterium]|nr:tRNA (adenosine(37)-N6)-dimethylallyltransferase MiaA [Candidatus Neomarinimicrobiota bacterium]MBL7022837.1 tRNA (adenosine(37)-N6)-dimethylallyltransferase MiaA [Candidatus Neomarinimicrobiota bacterium]MBL7109442.1 tRNA (adenosine(37)-N6)-dimethylallyltransferase MiaA [Candidatus Neomarinimicrobiota bacterium]
MNLQKIVETDLIVILGPTATGKTGLAVKIANELNGEIISADSRQVYRGMDIGTGKDLEEYSIDGKKITHHLIDILDPSEDSSVFHFQKNFYRAYNDIISRDRIPILCGGTGMYIESILMNYEMIEVAPDFDLRQKLEQKSLEDLIIKLNSVNPKLHNTTDLTAKNRVIRAIEIAMATTTADTKIEKLRIDNHIVFGVDCAREIVRERITKRLYYRLENGMIEEVEALVKSGVPFDRLDYFGLEYRFIGQYLRGELSMEEMAKRLNIAIHQFSKRQMTFFRRMERRGIKINWVKNGDFEKAMDILSLNG